MERIYVIPLREAKYGPSSKAAPRAIKKIKEFLSRHLKVDLEKIWIDESVNHAIWSRGKYKIPSKIRVRAVRFDDGVVEVSLPEIEFRSFREEIKAVKEAKKPILKKEEEVSEETTEEEKEEVEKTEEVKEEKEEIKKETEEREMTEKPEESEEPETKKVKKRQTKKEKTKSEEK